MLIHWNSLHQNAFDSVLAQGGTSSPSISSFLNFNAAFKQHYPYLQRQPSDSPQDPSSLATQQEFMSLPTSIGLALKNDKLATDQEKLNDVINSRRWVSKRNSCIWLLFGNAMRAIRQFGLFGNSFFMEFERAKSLLGGPWLFFVLIIVIEWF